MILNPYGPRWETFGRSVMVLHEIDEDANRRGRRVCRCGEPDQICQVRGLAVVCGIPDPQAIAAMERAARGDPDPLDREIADLLRPYRGRGPNFPGGEPA